MKRILGYSLLFMILGCTKTGNTSRPVRKDLTQAVYASGKIFPMNHYTLFSKFPGYVEKIHVKAGDAVRAGQPLITVQSDLSDLSVSTAKNFLQLAQRNADENGPVITSLKEEVRASKSKYGLDSLNFSRQGKLLEENATSKLMYDQSKTQFDVSKSTYIKATENLETNRERLKVEWMNAQNQLMAQQSANRDYNILSVINGKVYDVIPTEGDLVSAQIPLMEVGDSSDFEVELSVDETDISFLKTGQEVAYSIDAHRDQFFKGTIKEIFPKVNSISKTSRVKATFESTGSFLLYSGMSVEANIIVAEKKNTLVIPREFVKDGKVKIKGDDKLHEIKTGAGDLQFVEVLSGVSESDELVKQ